jgi:hypothetical protein
LYGNIRAEESAIGELVLDFWGNWVYIAI